MITMNYEEIKERLTKAQKAGLLTKIHKMDKVSLFEQVNYCTNILFDINDISQINICSLSYTILMIMHDFEISALKNPKEKITKIGAFLRKSHQIILKYEKELLQNNVIKNGEQNFKYISKEQMEKEKEVKQEKTKKEEQKEIPGRIQMIKEQEERLLIDLIDFEKELHTKRKILKTTTGKKNKQIETIISTHYMLNSLLNSFSSRLTSLKEEISALLKSLKKAGMYSYDYVEEFANSISKLNKKMEDVKKEHSLYKKASLEALKAINPLARKKEIKKSEKVLSAEEKKQSQKKDLSKQEINLLLQRSQADCGRLATDVIDFAHLLEENKKIVITDQKQALWIQNVMQDNFSNLQRRFKEVNREFQANLALAEKYGIDIKIIEKDRSRIMTSAKARLLQIEKTLKSSNQKEKMCYMIQNQEAISPKTPKSLETVKKEEIHQKEKIQLMKQEKNKEKLLQQKNFLASLKKLAPWALSGVALGFSASLILPSVGLTGVGVIRITYTGVKIANSVVSNKFLHAPTIIDQAIDMTKESVKKKYGTTKIYKKVAELNTWLRRPEIQWFLTGLSAGYVLGNILDLHEKLLNRPQTSGITTNLQEQIKTETEKVLSHNQAIEPVIEQPTIPPTDILPDYHWLKTGQTLDLSSIKQGFTNAIDAITNNNSTSILSNLASQENGTFINSLYLPDGTVYTGNIGDLLNTGIDPSTIAARITNQNGDFAYFNLKSILQVTKELVRTR